MYKSYFAESTNKWEKGANKFSNSLLIKTKKSTAETQDLKDV